MQRLEKMILPDDVVVRPDRMQPPANIGDLKAFYNQVAFAGNLNRRVEAISANRGCLTGVAFEGNVIVGTSGMGRLELLAVAALPDKHRLACDNQPGNIFEAPENPSRSPSTFASSWVVGIAAVYADFAIDLHNRAGVYRLLAGSKGCCCGQKSQGKSEDYTFSIVTDKSIIFRVLRHWWWSKVTSCQSHDPIGHYGTPSIEF